MGNKEKPSLPEAPEFQANPNVVPNIDFLSDVGVGLGSGNFLNPSDSLLGFLNPLVTLNPEATQKAVDLASRDVVRRRDLAQQEIINQLEANNQLTSSVTGNRLADLNEQFSGDIADIVTTFYLADVERALTNTSDLFKTGLSTTAGATELGLTDQGQRNEFALQNFSNQVAASALESSLSSRGGLSGALTGALGGGLTGFAATGGNPLGALGGAAIGGLAGGFGSTSTGPAIFRGGGSVFGSSLSGGLGPRTPGTSGGLSSTELTNLRNDPLAQRRLGPIFGGLT